MAELKFINVNYDERYIPRNELVLREKKIYRRIIRDLITYNFFVQAENYIKIYFKKYGKQPNELIRIFQFFIMKILKRIK